jgi:ankyrin repeat protein
VRHRHDDGADVASIASLRPPHDAEYESPTPDQINAYSLDVLLAVRTSDVDALRSIRRSRGDASLRCRNRYGEGLLHVACRRSGAHVVSYLLHEAELNPLVRDDYGRTPLHDACWRVEPDFDMVESLLRVESRLAFVRDVRGHMPFEYARKEHRGAWKAFLHERKDLFVCPRLVLPDAPTDPLPSPVRGRRVAASSAHSPIER